MKRVMFESDFVQIELVTLAWLSGDKNMRQVYIDRADLHERTARGMHQVPEGTKVTDEQRDDGKRMNFGTVYGQTIETCAEMWNLPLERVASYFEGFNKTYPGIKIFFDNLEKKILAGKKIITPWGRIRTPTLTGNFRKDCHVVLELKNFLIQSTAADMATDMLGYVFDWLDETKRIRICHPNNIVYDSIWGEHDVTDKEYDMIAGLKKGENLELRGNSQLLATLKGIRNIMQNATLLPIGIDLPINVDIKVGTTASKEDMHKLVMAA